MRARSQSAALAIAAAFGLAVPALAQAPPPAPASAPSPAAAADPAFEAAKKAFDSLSEADRRAVQDALVWTGYYAGVTDGVFGRRSRDALIAFETKNGLKPDGIVDARKQALLQTAGKRARDAVKFAAIGADPSGVAASLPMTIFTKKTSGKDGTRFQDKDGVTTFDTVMLTGADAQLELLYDRLKAESPTRKVTYRLLRPDWFVVSGEASGRRFYSRFARGQHEGLPVLRGFTLAYPAARAEAMERVAIAVANSFEPFPRAATATRLADTALPVRTTALSLGGGRWITVLPPSCATPAMAGAAVAVISRAQASGLTLLQGPTRAGLPDIAVAPPAAGQAYVLGMAVPALGEGASAARPVPTVAAGALTTGPGGLAVAAALQPGFAGAPVFDSAGGLAGLAGQEPASPIRVAGIVPAMLRAVVPASEVASLAGLTLPASGPPAQTLSAGAIAARGAAHLAVVECPRPSG